MSQINKPDINPNIMELKESATLAINLRAKYARQAGESVVHFGFGQSPFPVHPKIQIALANNAYQKDYLPTLGLKQLRESICNYYKKFFDYNFNPELVMIGPGSKELIFQALFVLEGSVYVPAPSWVSYGPQVTMRGQRIKPVITKRENGYKLLASDFAEALSDRDPDKQRMLILNNPSNPTGAVYTKEEMEDLVKVCRENHVIIISDEIYALINFSGHDYVGPHTLYPEGTIITSGLSKSHSAGGYRLGFLVVPPNMEIVMDRLKAMVSETFSAVSAPTQHAAVEAYSGDYDLMSYVKQCTKIHKTCGEYLWRRFITMGLECPRPEGAFYLFPDFSNFKDKLLAKGIKTCNDLSEHLFDHYRVAVLPGSDFYYPEDHFGVRVATVDYDGEEVYMQSLAPFLDVNIKKFEMGSDFVEKFCPRLKEGCDRIEKFLLTL